MTINDDKLYNRAKLRMEAETAEIFETVRKKDKYRKEESTKLIQSIGSSIVPLDNQRRQIDTLLKNTKDKKIRTDLLEQHYDVVNKINKFWNEKNKTWSKDLKKIDND